MNRILSFSVLVVLSLLLSMLLKEILNIDALLYSSLSEKLTVQQIDSFFKFQEKWQCISYVFVPIFLLIKTGLITIILYMGVYFFNKEVQYKEIWEVVIKAEYVFLLVLIFKILWFYFFQSNYTFEDVQYFFPLSVLNIVGYEGLETWYIYPFQVLNVFELIYWLILAYYIGKLTQSTMDKGLKVVAYSYGSTLLLWVVVVMFFTLNYS